MKENNLNLEKLLSEAFEDKKADIFFNSPPLVLILFLTGLFIFMLPYLMAKCIMFLLFVRGLHLFVDQIRRYIKIKKCVENKLYNYHYLDIQDYSPEQFQYKITYVLKETHVASTHVYGATKVHVFDCDGEHLTAVELPNQELDNDSSKAVKMSHTKQELEKATNGDKIRSLSDEDLAKFLVSFKNTFGEEYEGEISCLDWLKDTE